MWFEAVGANISLSSNSTSTKTLPHSKYGHVSQLGTQSQVIAPTDLAGCQRLLPTRIRMALEEIDKGRNYTQATQNPFSLLALSFILQAIRDCFPPGSEWLWNRCNEVLLSLLWSMHQKHVIWLLQSMYEAVIQCFSCTCSLNMTQWTRANLKCQTPFSLFSQIVWLK